MNCRSASAANFKLAFRTIRHLRFKKNVCFSRLNASIFIVEHAVVKLFECLEFRLIQSKKSMFTVKKR